ncbi:MAG TPA: carboxypeptidase-like regulatory domain-containing protein, partial [Longimicrobium sp.]|nr:carboxypeptidase-like regulatory domain-containing protein [Longimicrobium sp.]
MACVPSLAAQADTLAGRVIAADSTPIARATVRATAGDGRQGAVTTDAAGRYLLVMPAGAGPYALQASAFGYLAFTAAVEVEPGTGRAVRDFRLSARPVVLDEIRVRAATANQPERGTPAETARRWDSSLTQAFPIDPGDFADVGSIVPGVSRSGDGLSMAGQSPDQNGTTVDGATYGGGSLPSEGVRSVAVFGNTYDVSRGQFSGGQVAASTIGGTNVWGGVLKANLDEPRLRYGGPPAGAAAQ